MNGIDATMNDQLVKHLVGHTKADGGGAYVGRGFSGEHMQSGVPLGQRGWLGNPFEIGERIKIDGTVVAEDATRAEAVEAFQTVFVQRLEEDAEFRRAVRDLAGEPVDCW